MPTRATAAPESGAVGTAGAMPPRLSGGARRARGTKRKRAPQKSRRRSRAPRRCSNCGECGHCVTICGKRKCVKGGGKKPGKAKRRISGFIHFSNQHRQEVKDENPGIGFGEVGRELGKRWRELSDDEKQRYKDEAARM